jgi:YidC/Oxa1 family membrane protein insertase
MRLDFKLGGASAPDIGQIRPGFASAIGPLMQQDQDSQRNMLIAFALTVAVFTGWHFLYVAPRAKEAEAQRQIALQQLGKTTPQTLPANGTGTATTLPPVGTQAAAPPVVAVTREAAVAATPRLAISTPNLIGSINLRGAVIDDLSLVQYHEKVDPKSPNVVLLSPISGPNGYSAEFGWLAVAGTGQTVPGADTLWTAQAKTPLSPTTPAVLTWDNSQGLVFRRTISIDDKFMFSLKDEVENKSGRETALIPYGRIYRFGTPKTEGWAILHEGLIGWIGNDRLQEIVYTDLSKDAEKNLKEKRVNEATKGFKPSAGGWLGFTDKYWSAALIPPQDKPFEASFSTIGKTAANSELYYATYQLAPLTVAAGSTGTAEARLFGGAKQPKLMDAYEKSADPTKNIVEFGKMVDWGYLYFITKPLFWLLDWLYSKIGNFGLAILAVTIVVKGVFFPLQSKSYESMAKMKKLQPEMERLREVHKGDTARQQQELMALYKKEKINPAAGCLPVLLQVPVFFALYKVLFVTIDMRHAPFFGWIKDLSAPDPTSLVNLFGLLPFSVPEYLTFGVWPLIMGVTMFLQMQLNPQQPDPMQQKIFTWMPVMFTFMLASFPAGLVIYWAWSNTISLAQQYYITKKSGAEIHLWKNLGLENWIVKLKDRFAKKA